MRSGIRLSLFLMVGLIGERALAEQPAAGAVMIPGLWEVTMQTTSPVAGPLIIHTVCIDEDHVTRPEPPKSKQIDDCQVLPDQAPANESAYTVRCAKKKITSTSRFKYLGDHFEGTVTIKGPETEITQTYAAKRVGPCDDIIPQPTNSPRGN